MENTPWGRSKPSHLSSLSTNLTRGLAARRLFRVFPSRESTIHSQTSMSSPGFEPRPYRTAVSVTIPDGRPKKEVTSYEVITPENPLRYPTMFGTVILQKRIKGSFS
ncbi:hypothetical protein TNCV_4643991 [Trichonephila clavipes]|nr:hypothetical protein TNCV_4643991 [Trichonephila clavipes]